MSAGFGERRFGKRIADPAPWDDDGGVMRLPVYDFNFQPPRLVRICGWRRCMGNPRHRLWSPDISRLRLCEYCKKYRASCY